MYNEEEVIGKLSKFIDNKRFKHSLGVSKAARELARFYSQNTEKAKLAGLVHDCAKCLSYDRMINLCEEYGLALDEISMRDKALIHGPLGSAIAQREFCIVDEEILLAIACHTTGKKNMTMFEKIICLADYIEPQRYYPGVDEIRQLAFENINSALLKGFDHTIRHKLDAGGILHPNIIDARNDLLLLLAK